MAPSFGCYLQLCVCPVLTIDDEVRLKLLLKCFRPTLHVQWECLECNQSLTRILAVKSGPYSSSSISTSDRRLNCSIELSDLLPILGIDFEDLVKNWASFKWAQINNSPTSAQNCLLFESKAAKLWELDLAIVCANLPICFLWLLSFFILSLDLTDYNDENYITLSDL